MKIIIRTYGIEFETEKFNILFGNKYFTEDKQKYFSKNLSLKFMNQVHGTDILDITSQKFTNCDGLTTSKSCIPLAVKTADCLPIFIVHLEQIFAIHAGWRGLVSGILFSTKQYAHFDSTTQAFIGPHIKKDSFEVGMDIIGQALNSLNLRGIGFNPNQLFAKSILSSKAYLDLAYMAQLQLENLGVNTTNIFQTKVDTFTDQEWYSYRRDNANAGRNIHLVLKK